ncbi:hypothetical protein FB45DRAFT_1011091 [Roridomyces roridus]|uniref:Homeobox domain-containing protein n=1 Tax=Roridomyces roridus TaxID=1738132 RepID=A0AAD7B292_9AGAR|nr:hypothetical protein FB45DRAFT_1011091 [Roridomyces roridus]
MEMSVHGGAPGHHHDRDAESPDAVLFPPSHTFNSAPRRAAGTCRDHSAPRVHGTSLTLSSRTPEKTSKTKDNITAAQFRELMDAFARTPVPSAEELLPIERDLNLSARRVRSWFWKLNRRMRQSQRARRSMPTQPSYA